MTPSLVVRNSDYKHYLMALYTFKIWGTKLPFFIIYFDMSNYETTSTSTILNVLKMVYVYIKFGV